MLALWATRREKNLQRLIPLTYFRPLFYEEIILIGRVWLLSLVTEYA